jgi:hypothetical protein
VVRCTFRVSAQQKVNQRHESMRLIRSTHFNPVFFLLYEFNPDNDIIKSKHGIFVQSKNCVARETAVAGERL